MAYTHAPMGVHGCAWVCVGVRVGVHGCVHACTQVCARVRTRVRAGTRRCTRVTRMGVGGCARAFNLVGYLWHTKKTKFEKKEVPMPIL